MSNSHSADFGKFVPGFDFLQNLAKGAAQSSQSTPQMPNLASWIAPTLNVEELDKRISELKTVHFWLEQNSKALGATVQALEVQKMTLATLKGMNLNISEMANAFKLKTGDSAFPGMSHAADKKTSPSKTIAELAAEVAAQTQKISPITPPETPAAASAGLVDPMQLWGSLTQQFQQIAANAIKDASKNAALVAVKPAASKAATASKTSTTAKPAAKKAAAKTTGRSS